jgi:large-conductance mechanosensitive channel
VKDFKEFLQRGNLFKVAFVATLAFVVITALASHFISPLFAGLGGNPTVSSLHSTINEVVFFLGRFQKALIPIVVPAGLLFWAFRRRARS